MSLPEIVGHEEWRAARVALLERRRRSPAPATS